MSDLAIANGLHIQVPARGTLLAALGSDLCIINKDVTTAQTTPLDPASTFRQANTSDANVVPVRVNAAGLYFQVWCILKSTGSALPAAAPLIRCFGKPLRTIGVPSNTNCIQVNGSSLGLASADSGYKWGQDLWMPMADTSGTYGSTFVKSAIIMQTTYGAGTIYVLPPILFPLAGMNDLLVTIGTANTSSGYSGVLAGQITSG